MKYRARQRELAVEARSDEKFVEKMDRTGRPETRKRKIDDLEVTEMFCPSRQSGLAQPQYMVEQLDKHFRARGRLGNQHCASTSLEKDKKFTEQGAALVAVKCLEISPSIGLKGRGLETIKLALQKIVSPTPVDVSHGLDRSKYRPGHILPSSPSLPPYLH